MKKIFLIIFLLFFVSSVYAMESDNIKQYNPIDNEIIIKNSILGIPTTEVSRMKLITPQNFQVPIGENVLVAKIQIYLESNSYDNFLKEMELINLKNDIKSYKELKYKKLNIIKEVIPAFTKDCYSENSYNGTYEICKEVENGYNTIETESWEEIKDFNLLKGETTLGIFTDTKIGESYEWIPTMFGVKINEWASWDAIYCYQESSNISTACGGLSTGKYWTNSTAWDAPNSNLWDGDWSTSVGTSNPSSPNSELLINYTKPVNAEITSFIIFNFLYLSSL